MIVDDASTQNLFSEDDYLRARRSKSILCLPMIKQGQLTGLLYLENTLTSHAFTADRTAILELLAAQAAISLENARLYRDLAEREAKIRRLVEANIIGVFIGDFDGRIVKANDAFLQIVGYDREDLAADRINWKALTPQDWREQDAQSIEEHKRTESACRLRRNTSGKAVAASPFCWARRPSKRGEANLSPSFST